MIKFSVLCSVDGAVEVTIDDLNAVVFDGREDVQLVFTCPVCGDEIRVGVHIPNLYLAAAGIAELFDEVSGLEPPSERFQVFAVTSAEREDEDLPTVDLDAPHIDDYCEYFRRQLAQVEDVDAVLSEIDCE
jgi:hypothetical protein